jgi:hypothetical protein
MPKTTSLVLAALLAGRLTPALAQNTPDENSSNFDAPFVQHVRPDRPGQTITAGVLRAGELQLETGLQRYAPATGAGLTGSTTTLRIGFFNSMEFRVTQPYLFGTPGTRVVSSDSPGLRRDSVGWAPLTVGTKLMLTPDRASRFQASLLVEAALPHTGSAGLRLGSGAPGARLLLSQQLPGYTAAGNRPTQYRPEWPAPHHLGARRPPAAEPAARPPRRAGRQLRLHAVWHDGRRHIARPLPGLAGTHRAYFR